MAGGKMSARQKMINLMYLVFIAMLAMNMSKEVLSAFGFMNEKLTENNISTTEKNKQAYANLATKADEQSAKFNDVNKGEPQILNIGTGEPKSVLEFLKYWWKKWDAKGQLKVGFIPYRDNEVMRFVPKI